MRTHSVFRKALTTLIISVAGTVAFAASPPSTTPMGPSKDTREKMAVLHEQMAACLRSDKSIKDCRDEMMKNCQATVGEHDCPMMGMGHHAGRRAPSETSSPK